MTVNTYLNTFRSLKHSKCAMSWYAWDISTALFPVLHVFWRNNMASAVETSFENPRNTISETLNFQMSLDASALKKLCPWCEFKATYYWLSACYLKTFWEPWIPSPLRVRLGPVWSFKAALLWKQIVTICEEKRNIVTNYLKCSIKLNMIHMRKEWLFYVQFSEE